jgi:hypothetical protein
MQLIIENVPEDKAVITEILTNAETTIKNYHDKQIRIVPEVKEVEFATVVESFRTANKIGIKEEADGLGKDDGGAVKGDGIRPVGVVEPDPAKPTSLEPEDSGEAK